MLRRSFVLMLLALACGGDDDKAGPQPLEADPAVEEGCSSPPTDGEVRAKIVACEAELVSGVLAAGRVGDLVLENSKIRAIVRGPGEGYYFHGTTGGTLIDAAPVGEVDLLQELLPLVELNVGRFDEIVIVEAGDDGPAEIVVRGPAAPLPLLEAAIGTTNYGIILEQRYRLGPEDTAIAIETRVFADLEADDPAEKSESIGLVDSFFFGGYIDLFAPGRGEISGGSATFLASGGTTSSYGLVFDQEEHSSIAIADLFFLRLAEAAVLAVDGPAKTRHFVVGDGSVSSVTDRAWELYGSELGTVEGTTAPNTHVVASDDQGNPATVGRSDENGDFSFRVPPGDYELVVTADDREPGPALSVTVAAGETATADPGAGDFGGLDLSVSDGAGAIPARIVVTATGLRTQEYAGADGMAKVAVPPGTYDVVVSRGAEYDAYTATDVVVAANTRVPLQVELERVVDTSGWIAVDTHLHSEMSIDSSIPLDLRLRSVAGEGVEVAISTDHDFVVDYQGLIDELGLADVLASMGGQESSSLSIGHVNAWPMAPTPELPGAGALSWFGEGPASIFDQLRDGNADRVVQVNHPRTAGLGFFDLIELSIATLTASADPADLGIPGADLNAFGFDAIEVGNKKTDDEFEPAFADWLAFIASGYRIAATGASDSHGDDAYAGEARTYVYLGPGLDVPGSVDKRALNEAIRRQHVVVSQGAFVTASLVPPVGDPSLPGELVDLSGQLNALLRVRVQAAPWLPVSALVVYEGETEILRFQLDTGATGAVRYDDDITIPLAGADTVFVVAVETTGDGRPVIESPKPSFTNPLYVDGDGDGMFTPLR